MTTIRQRYCTIGFIGAAFGFGLLVGQHTSASAQGKNRVFEVRTATSGDRASRDALVDRFRQWDVKMFGRIGIQPVAFFVPSDSPRSDNTFFYIVAHENRQQAKESWAKLVSDPEFKEMSQKGASIGSVKVDSMFVDPLDFSPIK
jgi:hypothetical protein